MAITLKCSGRQNCQNKVPIFIFDPCGHSVCEECRDSSTVCIQCDVTVNDTFKSTTAAYYVQFLESQKATTPKRKKGRRTKKSRISKGAKTVNSATTADQTHPGIPGPSCISSVSVEKAEHGGVSRQQNENSKSDGSDSENFRGFEGSNDLRDNFLTLLSSVCAPAAESIRSSSPHTVISPRTLRTPSLFSLSGDDMSLCSVSGGLVENPSKSEDGAENPVLEPNLAIDVEQKSTTQESLTDPSIPAMNEEKSANIISSSFLFPLKLSVDHRFDWDSGVAAFSNLFGLLANPGPVPTLARLSFEILSEVYNLNGHRMKPISPMTESEIKATESTFKSSTVKLTLGQQQVRKNSYTRRQLAFANNLSTPPMPESEDIVEGTPMKPAPKRVDLLNESVCSPLSVVPLDAADEMDGEHLSTVVIENSEEPQRKRQRLQLLENRESDKKPVKLPQNELDKVESQTEIGGTRPESDVTVKSSESDDDVIDTSQSRRSLYDPVADTHAGSAEVVCPQNNNMNPVFATSGIYDSFRANAIRQLILLTNAQIAKDKSELSLQTTHLIVSETNGCSATPKLLKAIYYGMHVVTFEWVVECLKERTLLPESSYYPEACPGVARRMSYPKDHKLFDNFLICLGEDLGSSFDSVKEFVNFCKIETISEPRNRPGGSKRVVYIHGADYVDISPYGNKTVIHQSVCWLFSCVFSYQVLPFV
ncbi:BRCA1 C Terminus (BRCT) domain [Nesidiocoris tenuis]|uniref:BRCA1 C Terminus (BRCT) domain n=1 Tax=Nesidiocoris tenuis TaxID=355587 RepID=A0ABN7B7I2_9HEMI|nr:BRCA1 C Terminus (BRCT) domain [Nesidiocoris tenuis]